MARQTAGTAGERDGVLPWRSWICSGSTAGWRWSPVRPRGWGCRSRRLSPRQGAEVVLAARRAGRLADTAALVRSAGRRALSVPTDVAKPEDCQRAAAAAMAEFGRIDVLVNNAGIGTA